MSRKLTPAMLRFYDGVGRGIRDARRAAGLSTATLAKQIDMTGAYLALIESGQTPCSLYVASRIADALDGTIDDLAPVTLDEKDAAE